MKSNLAVESDRAWGISQIISIVAEISSAASLLNRSIGSAKRYDIIVIFLSGASDQDEQVMRALTFMILVTR